MAKASRNLQTTRGRKSRSSAAATKGKSGTPSPKRLRFHVFWSAEFDQGREYARAVFEWFRGDPGDLLRCGTGIPVEYHCVSEKQESVLDPAMDDSEIHILVLLIDNEFVLNRTLRGYVDALGERLAQRRQEEDARETEIAIPVHLDRSAVRLAGVVGERNSVHVDVGAIPSEETDKQRLERRVPRLLAGLTQMAARLVVRDGSPLPGIGFEGLQPNSPKPKLKVFVSHAKKDGREIAEKLRVEILRRGQLDAFFDEADLATGTRWADRLEAAAGDASGVMLVLFTDAYSSRRWCQREVRLARRPQKTWREDRVVRIIPVRVLSALTRAETVIPAEFAGLPIQQYTGDSIGATIDALVRDYVIQAQDAVRAFLLEGVKIRFACRPSAQALAAILPANSSRSRTGMGTVVAFPGAGVTAEGLRSFTDSFADYRFETIDSLEVKPRISKLPGRRPGIVGVSIGEDLGELHSSLGKEHIREAVVRIAQCLFRTGYDMAYGGDLRLGGFTRILFEVARGEAEENADSRMRWRRLANYLAWPRHDELSRIEHADLIDICRFVEVSPSEIGMDPSQWKPQAEADRPTWSRFSLSVMRQKMQEGGCVDDDGRRMPELRGRVLLGGKLTGYLGAMPGILEEAIHAIRKRTPTVLLGGFGGAAGLLARYILDPENAAEPLEKLKVASRSVKSIESARMKSAEALLGDLLSRTSPKKMLATGLSDQDLHTMLTTTDVSEACRIVNTVFPIPR